MPNIPLATAIARVEQVSAELINLGFIRAAESGCFAGHAGYKSVDAACSAFGISYDLGRHFMMGLNLLLYHDERETLALAWARRPLEPGTEEYKQEILLRARDVLVTFG